jgi:hypothetical protein
MAASSSVLVLALTNNNLLKLLTSNPSSDRQYIELGRRPEDRIVGMFLDPTANHLLVCVRIEKEKVYETFYVPPGASKPTVLKKWKGYRITSIGWNPEGKRDFRGTLEILVGTQGGAIFESNIDKDSLCVTPHLLCFASRRLRVTIEKWSKVCVGGGGFQVRRRFCSANT